MAMEKHGVVENEGEAPKTVKEANDKLQKIGSDTVSRIAEEVSRQPKPRCGCGSSRCEADPVK
jgi:hypothetical protein